MIKTIEDKKLYGTIDLVKRLEYFKKKYIFGIQIYNQKYTETYIEQDNSDDNDKHTIGFSIGSKKKK